MSKISLITKIEILAQGKFPNWIPAGEIELFSMNNGYLATHGGRRARDLVAQGKLERVRDGISVKYRWNPNSSPPEKKQKSIEYDRALVARINSLPTFISRGEKSIQNKLI